MEIFQPTEIENQPTIRGEEDNYKVVPPPVISWFINHSKYRYNLHKP